jgi:hypothetical protein
VLAGDGWWTGTFHSLHTEEHEVSMSRDDQTCIEKGHPEMMWLTFVLLAATHLTVKWCELSVTCYIGRLEIPPRLVQGVTKKIHPYLNTITTTGGS